MVGVAGVKPHVWTIATAHVLRLALVDVVHHVKAHLRPSPLIVLIVRVLARMYAVMIVRTVVQIRDVTIVLQAAQMAVRRPAEKDAKQNAHRHVPKDVLMIVQVDAMKAAIQVVHHHAPKDVLTIVQATVQMAATKGAPLSAVKIVEVAAAQVVRKIVPTIALITALRIVLTIVLMVVRKIVLMIVQAAVRGAVLMTARLTAKVIVKAIAKQNVELGVMDIATPRVLAVNSHA